MFDVQDLTRHKQTDGMVCLFVAKINQSQLERDDET